MIDTETLDQYQKSLDDEAHWLTEYAQGKGPKVGQCIINITVTMHRAAWALRELMKERLADDSGSYDALLPSAQPEIIRCKDCIYYDPPHVDNNGMRLEYADMPKEAFDVLGTGLVTCEYGINIGGRCTRDYNAGYVDDKRVYVPHDNFCGRAERRTDG